MVQEEREAAGQAPPAWRLLCHSSPPLLQCSQRSPEVHRVGSDLSPTYLNTITNDITVCLPAPILILSLTWDIDVLDVTNTNLGKLELICTT